MGNFCGLLLCLSLIGYATASPAAGVFQPNRIVVTEQGMGPGGRLHVMDIDARTDVVVPGVSGWLVAANQENVFLKYQQAEIVVLTTILDMRTEQVETIESLDVLSTSVDMDATADGLLYIAGEFGVRGIDPRVGEWFFVETKQRDDNHRSVEIDSAGAVITDFSEFPDPDNFPGDPGNELVTFLQRQRPGVEEPETIQLDVKLEDYALASDTELIGLCGLPDCVDVEKLYRIDLETETVELLHEEPLDVNRSTSKVVVDSLGRVIVLRRLTLENPGQLVQLVRFDPATGATVVMDLDFPATQFDVIPAIAPAVMAGDADLDFDFDQFDLVQVQVAGKYLTGLPATWGHGDWNGAPGGSVANPPVGDGLFNQIDIIAALNGGVYLTGPYAAVTPGGIAGDTQTSLIYDPRTGELSVDAPAGTELTSINIDSATGVFTGDAAGELGGSFDNDRDTNIFKATFGSSFGSVSFGNVAQTGLSKEFLLGDLTVVGSLAGGGGLGNVDLIYVPEPSTLVLLMIGLLGLHLGGTGSRNLIRWIALR